MGQESVVYGCIKDMVFGGDVEEIRRRREVNRRALLSLPSIEEWPLISREMFALPSEALVVGGLQTDVVAFGGSYRGVEYEWEQWIARFESLLEEMYWVSVTVHLETELSGVHTFTWEADTNYHAPRSGPLSMRCEWTRETSTY
ncbi:MAG: hypothetical protein RBS88_01900 [Spongiibacteraceae bacterium]|jgi:hypothetical protein|nr:hypothetical protein [Spongiibacteraceae bacterium]